MDIFKKTALCVFVSASLVSCGGGDSEGSVINNTSNNQPESLKIVHGGTVASPTSVSFKLPNEIKSDIFENYFRITVSAGDTIVIKSTLKNRLDEISHLRCVEKTGDYTIRINDDIKSCSLDMRHTFEIGGDYILHFKYPQSNYGHFDVALISSNASFSPSNNATGKPDDPRKIIIGGMDNQLSANDFYNNFIYDAQAGDTLHIQTYPNAIPKAIDNLRCIEQGNNYIYFAYGVWTNDLNKYNCAENFEHRYEKAGRYYLNIRFINGAEGFFRAVVVKGA